jgi:hypothetical protein
MLYLQNAGYQLKLIEIEPPRSGPLHAKLRNYPDDAESKTLLKSYGENDTAINVYLTDIVSGSDCSGVQVNNRSVIMGADASADLLAHEVSHCFALNHPSPGGAWVHRNIMKAWSIDRRNFTEGQVIRATFEHSSYWNRHLPPPPTRFRLDAIEEDGTSPFPGHPIHAPSLGFRIWDDE